MIVSLSRMFLSIVFFPVWMGIVLFSVSLVPYISDKSMSFIFYGGMLKLALWCSAFYDWHEADYNVRHQYAGMKKNNAVKRVEPRGFGSY
jgi:hypothetical protein